MNFGVPTRMLSLDEASSPTLKDLAEALGLQVDRNAPKADVLGLLRAHATANELTDGQVFAAALGGERAAPVRAPAAAPVAQVALAVNLAPPGPFQMDEGGRSRRWQEFLREWETYSDAMGGIPARQAVALFKHGAGPAFARWVENLNVTPAADETALAALCRAATARFSPADSSLIETFRLGEMRQAPGESTDGFISRLRAQAKLCDLRCPNAQCRVSLEDGRILDCLLRGTSLGKLRSRVLENGLKDLSAVLDAARAMETASAHSAEIAGGNATHWVDGSSQNNGNGRHKRQVRQHGAKVARAQVAREPSAPGTSSQSRMACKFCGKEHPMRREACPAWGKTCSKCSRPNHFAARCTSSTPVRTVADNADDTTAASSGPARPTTFSFQVSAGRKQLFTELMLEGTRQRFLLDTGSSKNIIPSSFLRGKGDFTLFETGPLTAFGGQRITPLGEGMLEVALPGGTPLKRSFVVMQVPDSQLEGSNCWPALLSASFCEEFGLLSANNAHVFSTTSEAQPVKSPGPSLPACSQDAVRELLQEYSELWDSVIPGVKGVKAQIQLTPEAKPRVMRARPVPLALRDKVIAELDNMVKRGTLQPVRFSKWASPMVTVGKPNGEVRLCADFTRTLVGQMDREAYPLPLAEQVFGQLGGGTVFSKLDLRTCFEQFELDPASRELTTVATIKGLMQYRRLPYGISSAPAIVQRAMEDILSGLQGVHVFLDDILLISTNLQDHKALLRAVFDRLRENNCRLKAEKCAIAVPEVKYLGFRLSKEGRSVDPENIKAIVQMSAPTDVSGVRSFLGMVRFYDRFLPNLAAVAAPLNSLLRADTPWVWGPTEIAAFDGIKEAICAAPILVHFTPGMPLVLATDAGPLGLGAVLAHRLSDGQEHPIAFASRTLTPVERRYSQIDREALAIVFGVAKFSSFLWGRHFALVTDNKPLTAILGPKRGFPELVTARLHRYAMVLSQYDFHAEFRRGTQNGNADALSRAPLAVTEEGDICLYLPEKVGPVAWDDIKESSARDDTLVALRAALTKAFPARRPGNFPAEYWGVRQGLGFEDGVLLLRERVVLPAELRVRYLSDLHATHQGAGRLKMRARGAVWWPGLGSDIDRLVEACETCQSHANERPSPLGQWPLASEVWERVHVDYFEFQRHQYLLLVDAASKWMEVAEMRSTTSAATLRQLWAWFTRLGLPRTVHSDGGPQFTSAEFKGKLAEWGVTASVSPPYHPQSNGLAERAVQTVKGALRKCGADRLAEVLFELRATPLEGGRSPFELLTGRRMGTRLTIRRPRERSRAVPNFRPGQAVYVRNLGPGRPRPKWLRGTVEGTEGTTLVRVEREGAILRRHVNQVRPAGPEAGT